MPRALYILATFLLLAFTRAADPDPATKPPLATELRILTIARDAQSIRVDLAIYNRTGKSLLLRNPDPFSTGVRVTKPDGSSFPSQISQVLIRKPLRKSDFLVLKPGETKTVRLTLPRITASYSNDWFNWGNGADRVGDSDFNLSVSIDGVNVRQKLDGEIPSQRIDEAFPAADYFRQEEKLTATGEYRAKDVPKDKTGKPLEPFDFGPRR